VGAVTLPYQSETEFRFREQTVARERTRALVREAAISPRARSLQRHRFAPGGIERGRA